ncbi:MAG: alanine dehydrogenase, partial [Chloroflexota bacterium]
MNISIPRETRPYEFRVGLVPNRVKLLTQAGHSCFVEHGAGDGSGFSDADYQDAGAQVVYSAEEAIHRGDLVLKFQRPTETELAWLREGQILMGYLMLPSARESKVRTLLEKRITAVSYELIEDSKGNLPVMRPMSQIGGRMCAQI